MHLLISVSVRSDGSFGVRAEYESCFGLVGCGAAGGSLMCAWLRWLMMVGN